MVDNMLGGNNISIAIPRRKQFSRRMNRSKESLQRLSLLPHQLRLLNNETAPPSLSASVGPSSATVQSKQQHCATANAGSTGHFLSIHAPHAKKKQAILPIHVASPDHAAMALTHVVKVPSEGPQRQAHEGHLFLALGNTLLISVEQLCDHECATQFDETTVTILLDDKVVSQG